MIYSAFKYIFVKKMQSKTKTLLTKKQDAIVELSHT